MRSWILSALLLTAATALGQPPKADPKPVPKTPETVYQEAIKHYLSLEIPAEKPPAKGSVDEAVLNALRQHPDIKLAEAKVRMAEAEAEQTKARVAQRVAGAFAKLEQAKAELAPAQEYLDKIKLMVDAGRGTGTELLSATAQFHRVKSAVVAAEVELNAAKGTAPRVGGATDLRNEANVAAGLKWLSRVQEIGGAPSKPVPAGTVADKLKAVIDRPVKLDLKGADLDEAMAAVLKAAGEPSLTVKLPTLGRKVLKTPPTVTHTGELSLTAAVQFILDEVNGQVDTAAPQPLWGKYDVYVREYGLLVARAQDAPPGAPTLAEFARQVRAEKAEKK